jgi:hypothetical protein
MVLRAAKAPGRIKAVILVNRLGAPYPVSQAKRTCKPALPDNAVARVGNRLKVVLKIPTSKRPIPVNSKATPTHRVKASPNLVKASNPANNLAKVNNLAKISRHKRANRAAEITPHPMGRGPEREATTKAVTPDSPNPIAMAHVAVVRTAEVAPFLSAAPKAATSVAV